jgi:2-succinyl-5-enolpyruvyl-6-hydroxy-3-cyclohexene-1-carboxylate synthase
MISDKRSVQDFFSLLEQRGIHHVVIAPGSRNAPFSISLHEHETIHSYSIADERSAAFVALGMAQQLGQPVVLICTSGTAALNFSPAMAEAFYQRIPLLVVTADRPVEWIDQGEGQSIRQRDVYTNFVKASYEVMDDGPHADASWYNVRIMDEAMRKCVEGVAGPVHLNFPLREPLYGVVEKATSAVKTIARAPIQRTIQQDALEALHQQLSKSKRVMILAGQAKADNRLHKALMKWALLPQVAVFTEAHSNLSDPSFVSTIDRLIMSLPQEQRSALDPEVVITVGHNIISRKIKDILRKGACEHWHVDVTGEGLDTLKHLNRVIPIKPFEFFEDIVPEPNQDSDYAKWIRTLDLQGNEKASVFLKDAAWSDLKAFDLIYQAIPEGSHLQMGNSSVVRYILLFHSRKDLVHFGNRGVAGIDGCTSTAVGAAFVSQLPTTLISGDVAFFYDSNAFWNNLVSRKLKIIVINNGGGGIFRIIDGPSTTPALEQYFETRHSRKASDLAHMYNIPCRTATSAIELKAALSWLYQSDSCSLLEVITPTEENAQVLQDYFRALLK